MYESFPLASLRFFVKKKQVGEFYGLIDKTNTKPNTTYLFCSELVAELFRYLGWLPRAGQLSNNYDIIDFCYGQLNKPGFLRKEFSLGPLEFLDNTL